MPSESSGGWCGMQQCVLRLFCCLREKETPEGKGHVPWKVASFSTGANMAEKVVGRGLMEEGEKCLGGWLPHLLSS